MSSADQRSSTRARIEATWLAHRLLARRDGGAWTNGSHTNRARSWGFRDERTRRDSIRSLRFGPIDLFASAGVDLPRSGGPGRGGAVAPRSLRVPLFAAKVVNEARQRVEFEPSESQRAAAIDYARKAKRSFNRQAEVEHARLWLILSEARFLGGATEQLLRDTDSAYKDITEKLYGEYKGLRDRLVAFMVDSAEGPRLTTLAAIEPAQKILDRVLFIAFAEGAALLPPRLVERAAKARNEFSPEPLWSNFAALFRAVDEGSRDLNVWPYNGGLFARDPILDALALPDELTGEIAGLAKWDYRSEVPVTLLGHIFEQSITDIERLKAEGCGEAPPKISQRK
jgi:hypothetical protein